MEVLPPTREEAIGFWKAGAVFSFRTHTPRHCGDAKDDPEHDGGVLFPIRGLRVPTTCGGPDVLGIPAHEL